MRRFLAPLARPPPASARPPDEPRPQQQVLRRVPGDRELGEEEQIDAEALRVLDPRDDPLAVPREVADDRVDLREAEPQFAPPSRKPSLPGVEIVIDPRFNGPPHSANGGYTCGLLAAQVGEPRSRSWRPRRWRQPSASTASASGTARRWSRRRPRTERRSLRPLPFRSATRSRVRALPRPRGARLPDVLRLRTSAERRPSPLHGAGARRPAGCTVGADEGGSLSGRRSTARVRSRSDGQAGGSGCWVAWPATSTTCRGSRRLCRHSATARPRGTQGLRDDCRLRRGRPPPRCCAPGLDRASLAAQAANPPRGSAAREIPEGGHSAAAVVATSSCATCADSRTARPRRCSRPARTSR